MEDHTSNNILIYHRFGDDRFPSTNVTIEQFESHISFFVEQDYEFVDLKTLIANPSSDKPSISITVDDAFLSFYDNAMPIIEKYQIPVTLFVSTEPVGGNDYMTWDQIREVASKGVDIQNHAHTHDRFPQLSLLEIENEIDLSQSLFEKHLGFRPHLFAYPYGETTAEATQIIAKNFEAAFGQHSGAFTKNNQFYIPRYSLNESYSGLGRIKDISRSIPFTNMNIKPEAYSVDTSLNHVVIEGEIDESINCYIADFGGSISTEKNYQNNQITYSFMRAPVPGRIRINCTKVAEQINWFGHQYFVTDKSQNN